MLPQRAILRQPLFYQQETHTMKAAGWIGHLIDSDVLAFQRWCVEMGFVEAHDAFDLVLRDAQKDTATQVATGA